VSQEPAPPRIAVPLSPEARADLRAIDRKTKLLMLHGGERYLAQRAGDLKRPHPPFIRFLLQSSDYPVFFELTGDNAIQITGVRDRRDAYR
jgi:hypothetical protein